MTRYANVGARASSPACGRDVRVSVPTGTSALPSSNVSEVRS